MKRCIKLSYYFCVRCNKKRGCPYIRPVHGLTTYKTAEYKKWYGEPPNIKEDKLYTIWELFNKSDWYYEKR